MIIKMTLKEWRSQGEKLFGDDSMTWRFKCPICGHVQTPMDFKPFKDEGASPNSAYTECIGRYLPKDETQSAMDAKDEDKPCDYASYGLFNLCPVCVITEDEKEVGVFGFDGVDYT